MVLSFFFSSCVRFDRELEVDLDGFQERLREVGRTLVSIRQRLVVPSLRAVQQKRSQEELFQRLTYMKQIQYFMGLLTAFEECHSQGILPLAASLLMEAMSLPLIADGGRIRLPRPVLPPSPSPPRTRGDDTDGSGPRSAADQKKRTGGNSRGRAEEDKKEEKTEGGKEEEVLVLTCMREAKEKVRDNATSLPF